MLFLIASCSRSLRNPEALQPLNPILLQPHPLPLRQGFRAERLLVEIDAGLIPLENCPVHPRAVVRLGNDGQLAKERFADPRAAAYLGDE